MRNSNHTRPLQLCIRTMLLVLIAAILAPAIYATGDDALALINGTLLDPVREQESGEVLILENGRISARLQSLPEGFKGTVIDLEGRFVSPGFNDLHVHSYGNGGPRGEVAVFGIEGTAERMLSVGVTGFLDLSSFEEEAFELRALQRSWRDRADRDDSRWLGADFYTAGAAFTVPEGHGTQFPNPAHEITSPEHARSEVIKLVAKKPDVIKLIYLASHPTLPSLDRASMVAIIDGAHAAGIKVVAHTSFWPDALEVVEAGVDAITHTHPSPVPEALLVAMKQRGTAIIPTLAVHLDLNHFLSDAARLSDPLLVRTSFEELRAAYRDGESPLPERMQYWRGQQVEHRAAFLSAVKQFSDAGVPVLAGSDSGNPGTFQGASLHRELALLVEAGLSPWAAMRAATSSASALLSENIGLSVEDLGNLVIFDASPIRAIENTATVSLVIHRGRVVDMERLDLPGPAPRFEGSFVETNAAGIKESGTAAGDAGRALANGLAHEAAVPTLVAGVVAAPSGYRLSHVEVELRLVGTVNALLSARTDADGRFSLGGTLPLEVAPDDQLEVVAAYPGFDPVVERLRADQLPASVDLTMRVSRFQESIVVEATSPTDESLQPQQEFGFLDIVATAGANADPMFATQTLPGVVKLDEGSGLYVRGGDTSEVATYLDRSLLDHPYRNETPTGGFFGTVDAFELEGLSLSAGGFPARYGNALSAVLELRTRTPGRRSLQATIGLGAVSTSFENTLDERGRTSLRLAANRRDATALVDLNNSQLDFREPPKGTDWSARLVHRANERHVLSTSFYDQTSTIGTELESGNFVGAVDSSDDDRVGLFSWNGTFGEGNEGSAAPVSGTLSLSLGEHASDVSIGLLEIRSEDRTWRARADAEQLRGGWMLRSGLVSAETDYRSIGSLPQVGGDFGGDQGLRLWQSDLIARRTGAYVETERALGKRAAFNLGVRYDQWGVPRQSAWDPRGSLSVRVGADSHVRLAWGRYHQAPASAYLTQADSADALKVSVAEHRVASWQLHEANDPFQLRVELYDKRYTDLPLETAAVEPASAVQGPSYRSTGFGFARGGDVYLGFRTNDQDANLSAGWRGFASYSYLEAERLYTPWQDNGRYGISSRPFEPDFAIPHTVQLVVHKVLPMAINASAGFRYATGRPTTPVIGVEQAVATDAIEAGSSAGGELLPIYGRINSERLPDFVRVDVSASRAFTIGRASSLLAFLGVNDVLDRRNVFRAVYSEDWSERRFARTAFGRTVYFGVSFSQ